MSARLTLVLGVVLALVAPGPLASAARRPALGGTVVIAVDEPVTTADPQQALTLGDWQLVGLVHRTLFRFDGAGVARPSLCRVEAQSERAVVLVLRDAVFHDGGPLTMTDVLESLRSAAPLRVTSLDSRRLEVRAPAGWTPARVAGALASPALAITRAGAPEVGLGPYRTARRATGGVELRRHTEDADGTPWLDGVTLRVVASPAQAFQQGAAHVALGVDPRLQPGGVRLEGVVPEGVGLLVRRGVRSRAALDAIVRSFPAGELARRLPGVSALTSAPAASGSDTLYLGVAEWQFTPVRTSLAASVPWPLEPLDRARFAGLDAKRLGDLDALFLVLPAPLTVERLVARGWEWAPLGTRRRPIHLSPALRAVWLTPYGTLDLGDAFFGPSAS